MSRQPGQGAPADLWWSKEVVSQKGMGTGDKTYINLIEDMDLSTPPPPHKTRNPEIWHPQKKDQNVNTQLKEIIRKFNCVFLSSYGGGGTNQCPLKIYMLLTMIFEG